VFGQQTKTSIDQHLMCELDIIRIKSFLSADAMQKLLSEVNFRHNEDCWIEDDSHIFRRLYYKDIFKCVQLLQTLPRFQANYKFDPVHLADPEANRIYSKMNMSNWWWDTQHRLAA
jgi:hypothetical protein